MSDEIHNRKIHLKYLETTNNCHVRILNQSLFEFIWNKLQHLFIQTIIKVKNGLLAESNRWLYNFSSQPEAHFIATQPHCSSPMSPASYQTATFVHVSVFYWLLKIKWKWQQKSIKCWIKPTVITRMLKLHLRFTRHTSMSNLKYKTSSYPIYVEYLTSISLHGESFFKLRLDLYSYQSILLKPN